MSALRKLHPESAEDTQGQRYRLEHHSFIHSVKLCIVNGKAQIEGLADQDFIHDGKKLVNYLLHPSRILQIGAYKCHMNHLKLRLDNSSLTVHDHGLLSNLSRELIA